MKTNLWKRGYSLLLSSLLALILLTVTFVWGGQTESALAESEPWSVEKFAEPAEVPPGGTVKYSIVLSRSIGNLVTPIAIVDRYDSLLSLMPESVSVAPAGSALWDSATPGWITFTVYSEFSVITMSFEAELSAGVSPGDVVSNTAVVSDGVNMALSNVATFTVSQPPATQITSPANGDVLNIPQGETLAVQGRSWITFDPPPFPDAPILAPIENFEGGGTYNVSWSNVAGGTNYVLEEATENGDFEVVYTGSDSEKFISGKAAGVYAYRVRAFNADGRPSRWSNVQTVTVTTMAQHRAVDILPTLSPMATTSPAESIVVEVSMDTGQSWHTAVVTLNAGGWWDWTYNWTVPEQINPASYPVMARARYAGDSSYASTDIITFTLFNGYPAFELTKQGPAEVMPDQKIFYTLTITNIGNIAATQVVVTDVLPSGVSYISATHGGELQNGVVRWELPEMTVALPIHLVFAVQPTVAGQAIINSDYRVSAAGNYAATGTVSVNTLVRQYKVYLPVVLKRWPPIPYPPTLSATTPDANGNFTVSWVYGSYPNVPAPTGYLLQEATNASFAGATEYAMGLTTSKAFADKAPNTYYYRVRGINVYGNGQWSNVVSVVVVVQNRYYNFNTTGNTEGWAVRRLDAYKEDLSDYGVRAMNSSLYTYIWGSFDEMLIGPMQEGPTFPYTIVGRVAFVDNETIDGHPYTAKHEMAYGIIFSGNDGTPCPAYRDTKPGQGCLSHYYRLLVVYNQGQGDFTWSLSRIDTHAEGNAGSGIGVRLIDWKSVQPSQVLGWNQWKISVSDAASNNIRIYLNNEQIGQTTDHRYINDRYFGTMMISRVHGQVGAKWDWFKVEK